MNPSLPATVILLLLIAALGCSSSMAPPKPVTQPSPVAPVGQNHFANLPAGIAFSYPIGWTETAETAVQFKFERAAAHLTLDVPDLPWHPFGLLTVERVRDGYIDDAKKQMPDAKLIILPDPSVADAKEHRVKLVGHRSGAASINEAVLLVHHDRVYILSIDSDEKCYPAARAALNAAVESLQWIN